MPITPKSGSLFHADPQLVALANHYGYQPRACRPYRAQTKGKVERPYRYIRQDGEFEREVQHRCG